MTAASTASCHRQFVATPSKSSKRGPFSASLPVSIATKNLMSFKTLKALKWSENLGKTDALSSKAAERLGGKRAKSVVVRCDASNDGRITQQEFTEMAWQAIVSSPEVAKESKQQIVETEHLMNALLEQKNGLAHCIFSKIGIDNTLLLAATEKFIQRQPKVLGESVGSILGRGLEALFQRARKYKRKYGDSFVSVEHLVLGYAEDSRFGKQLFKDFQISLNALKSAIQAIRGNQTVVDQECVCSSLIKSPKSKRSHLFSLRIRENLVICANSASSLIYEEKPSNLGEKDNLLKTKLLFLEERDEEILSERIIGLSRLNKVRSAFQLFVSVDALGLRPNSHACNSLIACFIRNGLVNDALRVFEMVRMKDVTTCHTYSLVIKAVASVQGWDSALKLFNVLEGETISKNFDIIVYNTMIAICGKAKNWVETERLWRVLKENEVIGTMITYSLLVSTFVKCGQMELALDAYHEMINRGIDANEDNMKAIVSCSTKEENWPVALKVFDEMLEKGMKPNLITYNSVINCLGKAGELEQAFRIYDVMKASGLKPDVYTWNALLTALYRSKHYSDALQFFKVIKSKEASQLNVHLYNTALMACQRLGLWERSLQLLWEMETNGIELSTLSYNHVISTCEAARKPRVALQVYQRMVHQKCAPDTFTYLSLIRACVWGSLWMEAEKILQSVAPDASLYNALIHGFCLQGKITLAKKVYTKMSSIGLNPDGKTRALMLQHLPNK